MARTPRQAKRSDLPLNARQRRFVTEYLVDANATKAAIRAGYSRKAARQAGTYLLSVPAIRAEVERRQARVLEATELTAERIIREAFRLAQADTTQILDENDRVKPVREWPPEVRAAASAFEFDTDGKPRLKRVKFWDKGKAQELLFRHLGLLKDSVHITGDWEALARKLAEPRRKKNG